MRRKATTPTQSARSFAQDVLEERTRKKSVEFDKNKTKITEENTHKNNVPL